MIYFCLSSRALYFHHKNEEDIDVISPFPSTWKCGVVVPDGLDPNSFDTKHLQGLCRSLEILVHMKNGTEEFGLLCGKDFEINIYVVKNYFVNNV